MKKIFHRDDRLNLHYMRSSLLEEGAVFEMKSGL
jgi:hypothetical protein